MVFIPTYLYIKQHSITGKLYFGKTTRNPIKYKGSGKHWVRHINRHGKEHVVSLWYQLYNNVFDLVADALSMSKSFDIVHNDSWLNLKIENGLNGGNSIDYSTTLNPMKGRNHSPESIQKMSNAKSGENNAFYYKTHTPETKLKISIGNRNKIVSPESKTLIGEAIRKYVFDIKSPSGEIHQKISLKKLSEIYELNLGSLQSTFGINSGKTVYKGFVLLTRYSK